MKENFSRKSGRRADKSRRKKKSANPDLADVIVDTRKCLSMLRRIVRKNALPEVPDIPGGPWLN
jgi:hypothetical protein